MKRYRYFEVNILMHHPLLTNLLMWNFLLVTSFLAGSSSRMSALFLCQLHNIQPLTQPNPPRESDTEMLTDEQQREIRKEKQGRREEERFSLLQALLVLQRQAATRLQFRQAQACVLLVVRPAFIFRALNTSLSNKAEL